ncbi:uncharacterized protein DUF4185 [Thiogranum longum]|uniref:Uncharacterized protein DUF4185 n=2 Tax=Thiogranum longum TaxID=1537524 RepID=A0A4R1HAD5_9GAMM|nr:uncharacterized protein DUF4185 [Thiogranum longum]
MAVKRSSCRIALACLLAALPGMVYGEANYPPSTSITGISFDMTTLRNVVPGNGVEADESDNWAITWADDDHQYASFGDGQGFRTTNTVRGSLGVSRIEGDKLDYSAFDVFKVGVETGGCGGKSVGILAVGSALYMFRNGTGSGGSAFRRTELYESTNKGKSWSFTGVKWVNNNFIGSDGFFSPSFLQFGKGYAGARDEFVYVYAPEETTSVDTDTWNVQIPGKISLLRVPKVSLTDQSTYEYFAGLDGAGNPLWTTDINGRLPAFEDPVNGIMRTSVSFNAGLGRYLLITQQVNRFRNGNFHIGIYEAPEPWGPWQTILFENAEQAGPGLNVGKKTVFWNFSNKWLSPDGRNFVLVYTGPGADQWGTVEGTFLTPP